jgi:hypothetical protein
MNAQIYSEDCYNGNYRINLPELTLPEGTVKVQIYADHIGLTSKDAKPRYLFYNEYDIGEVDTFYPQSIAFSGDQIERGNAIKVYAAYVGDNGQEIKKTDFSLTAPERYQNNDSDGLWRIRFIVGLVAALIVIIVRKRLFGNDVNFSVVGIGAIASGLAAGFTAGLIGEVTGWF